MGSENHGGCFQPGNDISKGLEAKLSIKHVKNRSYLLQGIESMMVRSEIHLGLVKWDLVPEDLTCLAEKLLLRYHMWAYSFLDPLIRICIIQVWQ